MYALGTSGHFPVHVHVFTFELQIALRFLPFLHVKQHFDWLNYGSTIFYTTSGETRMDSWTSEELNRGWSSSENTFSSNQRVVYARTGFLKLGKTGYGGDLISRPL